MPDDTRSAPSATAAPPARSGVRRRGVRPDGLALVVILGVMSAFGPLSIDLYLPALPLIARDFAVDASLVQQSLSLFFLGLAAGQLAYGPLADRFGRRPPLLGGIVLYFAASLVCALAPDVSTLNGARLVQGLGAAAGPVLARAVVRDLYEGRQAARMMSFVILVMTIAPLLAPVIGGWLTASLGWRAAFWCLVAFAVLCLALVQQGLPETHPPARRSGATLLQLTAAYGPMLRAPVALGYLLCGGMTFGALFAYVTGSPFVYTEVFGVPQGRFGYYFAFNVLGLVIGNLVNGRLVMRHGYRRMLGAAVTVMFAASWLLAGLTLGGETRLAVLAAPLFLAVGTVGMAAANTVAGLLDRYPQNSGAASALFGLFQFGLGAVTGSAVGALGDDPLLAMTGVMAGAATIAMASYITLRWLVRRGI